MLIGFISDAHGNYLGLQKCIEALNNYGAERIYFMGDAIGYWPFADDVINTLQMLNIPAVKGNHEAMLLGLLPIPALKEPVYRLLQCLREIRPDYVESIRNGWPDYRLLNIDKRNIILQHGRPNARLNGYLYENSRLTCAELDGCDVLVVGHTHHPYTRVDNNVLIINAGSCGLPRDGSFELSCSLYDSIRNQAVIIRIPFDFNAFIDACPVGSISDELVNYFKRPTRDI